MNGVYITPSSISPRILYCSECSRIQGAITPLLQWRDDRGYTGYRGRRLDNQSAAKKTILVT